MAPPWLWPAEREIRGMLKRLDVPFETTEQAVAISLGMRGGELFRGLLHACKGPSATAAEVVLRAIVDLAILVRWIEADPRLHIDMWMAEDDRNRLTLASHFEEMHRRRVSPVGDVFPEDERKAMRASIARVRARALEAGEKIPDRGAVLPSAELMANSVPDLYEAYQIAYRAFSPATHSGGRSFVKAEYDRRADGLHMKMAPSFTCDDLRAVAAPAMLALISAVSRQANIGLDARADELRVEITRWGDPK